MVLEPISYKIDAFTVQLGIRRIIMRCHIFSRELVPGKLFMLKDMIGIVWIIKGRIFVTR